MAKVKEIQVCGGTIHTSLYEACKEYIKSIDEGWTEKEKLHFTIILSSGKVKCITIRQEGDGMVAYGDFEGLPNFLDWAQGKD